MIYLKLIKSGFSLIFLILLIAAGYYVYDKYFAKKEENK
jgi:hypothetical protein